MNVQKFFFFNIEAIITPEHAGLSVTIHKNYTIQHTETEEPTWIQQNKNKKKTESHTRDSRECTQPNLKYLAGVSVFAHAGKMK